MVVGVERAVVVCVVRGAVVVEVVGWEAAVVGGLDGRGCVEGAGRGAGIPGPAGER